MKYKSKPKTIDAWQWNYSSNQLEPPAWVNDALTKWPAIGGIAFEPHSPDGPRMCIATLDAVAVATPGDWICRGTASELYPCKPAIFAKLYEIIDPQPLNPIVKLWGIPPGTRAEQCHKCPATIYMVPNENSGKPMPLAVAPELETKQFGVVATLARAPTMQEEGFGYSHFADCPAAASFRTGKK